MHSKPTVLDAIIPIAAITILLSLSVYLFGDESSLGANQIALFLCTGITVLIGIKNGYTWKEIERGIVEGISHSMGAILILFAVGAMIGTWILAGTVPAMIFWGMKFLSPDYFYAECCVLCALTALCIGSSWTTAGTLGIGLIGIANGMGLSVEITAGAIISGAYFGDKLSPLSETTNMASAVTESDLFKHIQNMLWTTLPSFALAAGCFLVLGFYETGSKELIGLPLQDLDQYFNINILVLMPMVILLLMVRFKVPPFPAIFSSAILGGLFAVAFQPTLVMELAGGVGEAKAMLYMKGIWIALYDGYQSNLGMPILDDLLSKGGMSSMLVTVWLIISAMAFGGALQCTGLLQALLSVIKRAIRGATSAILTTMATCLGMNVITGDQYISIVLPGRMYQPEFKKLNISSLALSRAVEDAGTISSPLVPWNTCGAYMAGTLGVATLSYLPYALFNLFNLALAVLFASLGWFIVYRQEEERFA